MKVASPDLSARDALLDTAEQMFSACGFDGVSLRDLTKEAGTNLASVNYHFGSKEKLFHAVIHRRIGPMNEQRVASLKKVLDDAGKNRPTLAAVLEAFARPVVVGMGSAGRESLRQIAVRLFTAADPLVKPIIEREFAPVGRQFMAAIAQACPELSREQVNMGFIFYLGAMINVMANEKNKLLMMQWAGSPPSDEETLQMLIRFGIAGFSGFATGRAPPSRKR
ncbi:MAG: transcriptional regulator, TetR family [Phycisphaerales bacterium]|nr:transcriptional regulator, TetR family [Phycisphaerales bacterium]